MDVGIVGSGIGGLTTAIALRRNGHHVTLFEQSRLNQETAAAIFLPPNVNGLLRDLGFIPEKYGATEACAWRSHDDQGTLEFGEEINPSQYPSPWQTIHRQQLHSGLKEVAEDPAGPGPPAKIHISSRAKAVDAQKGIIHLEDGTQIKKDIVIGADGSQSATRAAVQAKYGTDLKPFQYGENCFRFLIPRHVLMDNPVTKEVFSQLSTMNIWEGPDRRLISYPCDHNATMNFVAIHPSRCSNDTAAQNWTQELKDLMLDVYDGFCPLVMETIKSVKVDALQLYRLFDMDPMPSWTNGSLALVGDAAHPFLPFMGQGGAQAIEDGVSLGVFLPAETKLAEIPARLALYERARKQRAHHIQDCTRRVGGPRAAVEQSGVDYVTERNLQYRYNEVDNSRRVLGEHLHEVVA